MNEYLPQPDDIYCDTTVAPRYQMVRVIETDHYEGIVTVCYDSLSPPVEAEIPMKDFLVGGTMHPTLTMKLLEP